MRVDARTKGAARLEAWAAQLGLPFLGAVRESQVYVRSAEEGLTLFDLPAAKVDVDLVRWQPILGWVEAACQEAERVGAKVKPASAPTGPASAPTPSRPAPPVVVAAARPGLPAPVVEPFRPRTAPQRGGVADRLGRLFNVFRNASREPASEFDVSRV
jgi:chromosome partitioning protein